LNEPRTGHTATLLPDGRVLILGGSRTDDIRNVSDLVETAEIYDPATRTFTVVPFTGSEPIRRALHTAVFGSGNLIDLYGGRGDIRYGDSPRLGTRSDLRTLRFADGTLEPLTNLISAPSIEPLSGHTQTPLRTFAPGTPGFYLVAGSFFDEQGADDVSFQLDFSSTNQIAIDDAPTLEPSRTRHAGVMLQDGIVAYFGGTQDLPSEVLDQTMIYAEEANQFFRLPRFQTPIKRYAHTATKLSSQRILLLGGFTTSGNSLSTSEFFDSSLSN
ncbi:MAG TPA: kelch repeat-containing protein, partial [Rhodothermales bacterium]|nr:kelch repeat-containing protein [Rhodothermales bacterium]